MSDFVDQDFQSTLIQLKDRFNYRPNQQQKGLLRKLHYNIYTLCDLNHELSKYKDSRTIFLDELNSELVQILVLLPLGFHKPVSLLKRACIEDTLKHIYYVDHSVEFSLLNESERNKVELTYLFSYLYKHPKFKKIRGFNDIYNPITFIYDKECKVIHGASEKYLQLNKTISKFKIDSNDMKDSIEDTVKLVDNISALLIIFHTDKFYKIKVEKRNAILKAISNNNKKIIHQI
jgi:hypothetical protein